MSVASQFFPSSGGGGGSATEIPVEILGMGGGGGSGTPDPSPGANGGTGGNGGLFHATSYSIEPGVTVPITIGLGGSPSACPNGAGGQGGATSFNYPKLPISVVGGGGGSKACAGCSACPGGSGGGGHTYNNPGYGGGTTNAGCGCYNESEYAVFSQSWAVCVNLCSGGGLGISGYSGSAEKFPWGIKSGYPGLAGCFRSTNPYYSAGYHGRSGGNAVRYAYQYTPGGSPTTVCCCLITQSSGIMYNSSMAGDSQDWGAAPTSFGRPAAAGGLIIKWATVHGASPSYPGATDISPQTPGYYTYCFTTSGSITLP